MASYCICRPHRIGLSAPLSGGGAGWGNDVRNVLTFANEKLAAGQYTIVAEDDRCDPKTSLSVAQKLSSIDHVDAAYIVCGQIVLSTSKTYLDLGIPVFATLATPSKISSLGVFRTALSDVYAAAMLVATIARDHKAVFVLTEENDYPRSFYADFASEAKHAGLHVQNESYLPQQFDFRSQLLRMKSKGIDALFLNTQTEQALHAILKQLKELNFAPKLYGAYMPGSATFLKLGGPLAEGMVYVDFPTASDLMTAEGNALFKEYEERFGQLQGWSYAFPGTFEGFRVLHMALVSGKSIPEYLKSTQFDGIIGHYTFNQNGDIVGPKHVMRIIHNGAPESL